MLNRPSFKQFFKNSILFLAGMSVFAALSGGLYYVDSTYRIKHFVISNDPHMVVAGLPSIQNKYIFLTSEDEIADIITRTNPSVKAATVIKEYPDTIKLSLTRYQPVAYLKSQEGYFLLAEEGIIIGKSGDQEKKNVPVISYYQSIPFAQYQAGTRLPAKDIRDSIFFLGKLGEMGIKINSIDIVGFHMLGLYTDEKKYFFSSEKERNIQIYHIEQAINRFKDEEKEYKTIDVRFEKPVITF